LHIYIYFLNAKIFKFFFPETPKECEEEEEEEKKIKIK
jgi:hypothetical protein